MPKQKRTLKNIDLTNGEFGTCCELASFLIWMKQEGAPIPERFDGEEIDYLLVRYIEHRRREQWQYISDLRVRRGEPPLPKRLLKGVK